MSFLYFFVLYWLTETFDFSKQVHISMLLHLLVVMIIIVVAAAVVILSYRLKGAVTKLKYI